jgi:hypothetical protein
MKSDYNVICGKCQKPIFAVFTESVAAFATDIGIGNIGPITCTEKGHLIGANNPEHVNIALKPI